VIATQSQGLGLGGSQSVRQTDVHCVRVDVSGGKVIVRVLTARIRAAKVAAFNARLRQQVALLREQPGLEYLRFARRFLPDGDEEAILLEEWEDSASLYSWVGPNLAEPRLIDGVRELVDDLQVAHYEVLATGAEDPVGERG